MSYLERYKAEQRGYVERGLDASYAYAGRILAGITDEGLGADAAAAVSSLREAMERREPIAAHMSRLFVAASWAFKPEHIAASPA